MSRKVTVAAVQCALGGGRDENVARVTGFVREAAKRGAQIVITPELLAGPYFCKHEDDAFFTQADVLRESELAKAFSKLAAELKVVLPLSFFERDGHHYYNSVVVFDADGAQLGVYRKSHIPAGPGYQEKYYFRPGETGFKAWATRYGVLGVGICWDQWFPESARAMALQGAELLAYPTAIGSEPHDSSLDTKDPWQRAMIGHAVCNSMPVIAANRIGTEDGQVFYGSSFIADEQGTKVEEFGRADEGVLVHSFDLDAVARYRAAFGFFRDRRPELYGPLAR